MILYASKNYSGKITGAIVELNYKPDREKNYRRFKSLDSARRWLKSIGYYCIGSERITELRKTHWYYQSKRKYPTVDHWYKHVYDSLVNMCTPESKPIIDKVLFGNSNNSKSVNTK